MPLPPLTQDQIDALTSAQTLASAGELGALQAEAAWQQAIDEQQKIDDAFALFFDYYNNDIIRLYEIESRYLNGADVEDPIVEQDLLDFSNKFGRLFNAGLLESGDYSPERIDQFDGQPLTYVDDENEQFLLPFQDGITSDLVTFPAQNITFDPTAVTNDPIDANTVSFTYTSDGSETVNVNDLILISDGVLFAIVKVLTIIGVDELGIEMVITPNGTILPGAELGQDSYEGFTDSERSSKTATNPDFQIIMDSFLDILENTFNRRISVLSAELTVANSNQDDNFNNTAITNIQNSIDAVNGFLGISPPSTIDISDTGLAAINSESSSRQSEVTQRITDISAAISFGDFYNLRYQYADSRGRLDNGSLTLLIEYQAAQEGQTESRLAASNLESRYADILAG